MGETSSQIVRLGRYGVLEELNRIFATSKGIGLKDVLSVVCKSDFSEIHFNVGNLEITFNDYEPFDEFDDESDRMISLSLKFENVLEFENGKLIQVTKTTRKYFYSEEELESFLKELAKKERWLEKNG